MLTKQHIQEGLSIAYVTAVANRAGIMCDVRQQFDYKVDGTFSGVWKLDNGYDNNGYKIDFQLKASVNVEIKENIVYYDLDVKNYNDLIITKFGTPRILIVLKLPKDESKWLNISEEEFIIKNCAWWCTLKGAAPSDNEKKQRIYIPRAQVFDTKAINTLMEKVEGGDKLWYSQIQAE
jgi:hypothetical protein